MQCRNSNRVRLRRVSTAREEDFDDILVKIMRYEVVEKVASELGALLNDQSDEVCGSVDMLLNELLRVTTARCDGVGRDR